MLYVNSIIAGQVVSVLNRSIIVQYILSVFRLKVSTLGLLFDMRKGTRKTLDVRKDGFASLGCYLWHCFFSS